MKKLIVLSTLTLFLSSCGKDNDVGEQITTAPLTFSQLAFQINGVPRIGSSASYTRTNRRVRRIDHCEFISELVERKVVDILNNGDIVIEEKRTPSGLRRGNPQECSLYASRRINFSDKLINVSEAAQAFNRMKQDFDENCIGSCQTILQSQLINGQVEAVLTTKGHMRPKRLRLVQDRYVTTVRVLNTRSPWLAPYKSQSITTLISSNGSNQTINRERTVIINN